VHGIQNEKGSLRLVADAVPVAERVVTDGKYVTAAGVSAGLDLALTLWTAGGRRYRAPPPSGSVMN
jgi:hypothetical protein